MNPKTTVGLVIALAIAAAGIWWAQSSTQSESVSAPKGPQPIFDLPSGDVVGYEIRHGTAPALSFSKKDEQWMMTAPISGPSQQSLVNGDISRIANLNYTHVYPKDDPDRPSDEMTSLNKPRNVIKLTNKSGKTFVLEIGNRQKLSAKTYVQKEGDDAIYLADADLNKELHRKVADYRNKRVAEFVTSQAKRIEVKGNRNYTLIKENGRWTIESPLKARADASVINTLLQSLSNLTVQAFVEDAPASLRPYGLEHPPLAIAVTTEKKTPKPRPATSQPASQPAKPEYNITTKTVRVAFGAVAEKKIFAKLDDAKSRTIFQVGEDVLAKIGPELNDLRDKKIAGIQAHRVQKIKLIHGTDSVEISKAGSDWKITTGMNAGTSVVAEFAAVDDLLKTISNLKALGFEDRIVPSFGFDSPRVVLELGVAGQIEPIRLELGGLAPSKTGAYIRNVGEGFVAVIPTKDAQSLTVKPVSFLSREMLKFSKQQASRLEVVRGGTSSSLDRTDLVWRFTSPVQGIAEAGAVNNILSNLSSLRGRRVVARSSDADRYGLTNPSVRVTVTVNKPPKPVATTQPATTTQPVEESQPPQALPPDRYSVRVTRHGDKTYAMMDGGSTICEVDGKILDDLEAELLDTHVLSLEPSQGQRLTITGPTSYDFEKRGDDWKLVGEPSFPTDASKITALLQDLRSLRVQHYVAYSGADLAKFGLDHPEITIRVQTLDDTSGSLMISTQGPAEGGRYAYVSTRADRVFILKPGDVNKFEKKVTDFQKTPKASP